MEEKFDTQKLMLYLLGSLSESEVEQFDELSITSDEFSDALTVAEADLVDDYIRGSLEGEILNKFRTNYLASPVRREKVDFARALHASAGTTPAEATDSSARETSYGHAGFFGALPTFFSPKRLALGFAAVLILAIGGFWLATNRRLGQDQAIYRPTELNSNKLPQSPTVPEREIALGNTNRPEPSDNESKASAANDRKPPEAISTPTTPRISIASFVLTPPLRSGALPTFAVPRGTSDIAFRLQLEPNDHETYRVTLTDESGKQVWGSSTLRAVGSGSDKTVAVRFSAKLVRSGIYSFTLSGDKDLIGSYPFKLEAEK